MPTSKLALAITLSLAVVAAVGATLALAGPLSPPPGPVQPTSPSLGDVLAAVQSQSTTPEPCAEGATPGALATAVVSIPDLADGNGGDVFDAYEVRLGAQRSFQVGQPTGRVRGIGVEIVRDPDLLTPRLLVQMADLLTFPQDIDIHFTVTGATGGGPRTVRLQDAYVQGIETRLVETCEGGRWLEVLTLFPQGIEYDFGGVIGGATLVDPAR